MTGVSTDIHALALGYLDAISHGRSPDIAARYADDATLEDPVGTTPLVGRDAIESFYRGLDGSHVVAEPITIRTGPGMAIAHFRVTTTTSERVVVVDPVDILTFDDTGLITSMRAFWTPDDVVVRARTDAETEATPIPPPGTPGASF